MLRLKTGRQAIATAREPEFSHPVESRTCRRQVTRMSKQKTWKCSACGVEVADLPMTVLRHQLCHVERRGLAVDRPEPDESSAED
jgi:ribosomal protein L37AE/L43A